MKQVLLSTSLLLRIKNRPFHNSEFLTDFCASEKNTNDVKKVAHNYIQKLQNSSDLYIFRLISVKISFFSDRLSATFEVIITFIIADSIYCFWIGREHHCHVSILYLSKWQATESHILILKMAIADLLVTLDIYDAIQRSCSQHREQINWRTFWRNFFTKVF